MVYDMQQITSRIEAAMESLDLSLTRLAEQSGVPRQTLARRLLDPSSFSLGELEAIARVLNSSTEALVFGDAA
jgi:transcriptional regulator with XRE-family HTH domain